MSEDVPIVSKGGTQEGTGSFKDATASIIFFANRENQNYDIFKNVPLLII
jgi:hypothetical protein